MTTRKKADSHVSVGSLPNPNFKIVVIGDGTVGKTCLCNVYVNKEFPQGYEATVFDSYPIDMPLHGGQATLQPHQPFAGAEGDHMGHRWTGRVRTNPHVSLLRKVEFTLKVPF